jgi:hypothetical protein
MAFSASRRKLADAKATTQYLEAFFDATRLQSEANRLVPDIEHAVEQQRQIERERMNWWHSKPAKKRRTLTDSATAMVQTRKRIMGFGDHTDVDAALAQREQDAVQREQAARQAHAQKRATVGGKLQRMSEIQHWGQTRYGAHRFPWPQYVEGDYGQLKAYADLLGVDTMHDLSQQEGGHYISASTGKPTASQQRKYKHTHPVTQMERAKGAYVREGGAVVDAKTGKLLKDRPAAQTTQSKPRRRVAPKPRGDDSIFDTPAQRTAREDAERAKAKQRDAASWRRANQRAARDTARKRKADESIAAKKAVVAARKETDAQKQRDARARLKAGTSGNAYLKFRDEQYARGNFDVKAITDRYNREKERRRIDARDARDRADDLAFAQQEYDEEMAERTASARAAMERVGPIPRQQRGDGYYAIHPVYGTVQHGAGLKESAASVLKHLLYKYGLPAVQHMLTNMANYDRFNQFPGHAGREMKLMDELARQHGMGLPENRVEVQHTSGANDQFVIAGSGQRAPLPGYHRMSTGEHMRDDEQHGGAPTLLFGPGDTIQATTVSDAVGNASGLTGVFAGLAGALATAAGVGQTPAGIAALENTPMALSSVAQAAIDDQAPTPAPVPKIVDDDDDAPAPVPKIVDEDDLEDIVDAVDAAEPAPTSSVSDSTRTTLDYARGNAPRGTLIWDADKRTYVPAPSPAPDVAPGTSTTLRMGTIPPDVSYVRYGGTGGIVNPDADSYLQRYSTTRYNPAPTPSLPDPHHVISNITRASLDYTREVFASLGSVSLKIPGLQFASIPGADDPQFTRMSNGNILGSLLNPTGIIGMLAVTQFIGQNILRKLRESNFGAIIDQKTGERRKMTPLEEQYAMFLLGGRKGNTLRNHIRALLYGVTAVGAVATPAAMLGYKVITGLLAMASPEWAQSNSNLDAFVNVFSWFTAYGQASSTDAMTQGAANLNAVQQMMSESASYADRASAVSKSSIGLRVVDRVAMYVARNTLGLGVLGAEVFSEVSQSTVRGDGNPLAGMTEMDKLGIQASGSTLESMSSIVDMGGAGNIGMQASLPDRPIGADLVASMASMVEDAGGVFAAMGDAVLQAADETERLGTIELAKANPQTQMLARWLKTQHFMQRWLGMSFGVTFGEDHMEFYALVNELIEDWILPIEPSATQAVDPRNAPRSDAIATRGPTYVDVTPPTSFELQLMVREELSRTKEDGTLMYPHLQKFMPPVPSRFVQTRESTQEAIRDTYNGDGKVYAALRAAAYFMYEVLSQIE